MTNRSAFLVDVEGQRIPLELRLVVGRSHDVDVVIRSSRVARQHLALVRLPNDELEAEDLGSSNGTRLNGVPLRHAQLAHGDVLELDGLQWTIELGPKAPIELDAAAALVASADSDAALQVVIDVLLERGDPAGALLAEGQPRPLSEPLKAWVSEGVLDLEWRRGFIHFARVREQVRPVLFELVRAEAARFLSVLCLPEYQARFGLDGAPMQALRSLQVGPFFAPHSAAQCSQALGQARFSGAPHLSAPEVQTFSEAWLEFPGAQRRNLEQGRQETFPSCTVRWEPTGWIVSRVRQSATLRVNGRSRFAAVLIPGDEVSSGPTRFTLRAR